MCFVNHSFMTLHSSTVCWLSYYWIALYCCIYIYTTLICICERVAQFTDSIDFIGSASLVKSVGWQRCILSSERTVGRTDGRWVHLILHLFLLSFFSHSALQCDSAHRQILNKEIKRKQECKTLNGQQDNGLDNFETECCRRIRTGITPVDALYSRYYNRERRVSGGLLCQFSSLVGVFCWSRISV